MEKRRSQVYQRRYELPKPNVSKEYPAVVVDTRKCLHTNQKLIDDEMIELIKRDLNGIHPEDDPSFYCFSSEQLAEAKAMLAEEAGEMPDSFAEQIDIVFSNMLGQLTAAGATMEDVIKLTGFIVDIDSKRRTKYSEARARYFSANKFPPASTLIGVSELVSPILKVEVEAIAVIEDD